jgi:RNA-directed DNA polymerase
MNFEQYKIDFSLEASKSGFSAQNIQACLQYAEKLFSNNVPIIYNTSHLSVLVGYRKNYIKKAALFTSYFYRNFEINKKNGKKRLISEPLPSLKEIQIWILNNILYKVDVSKYAKAYVPNTSIKQNLVYHKGQPQVLTLDIQSFFPSIKTESIRAIFQSLGYSQIVSSLLAKLCSLDGCLPQGSPTSPYLSNIYLKEFDNIVYEFCHNKSIRFTRYADDMTFSGKFDSDEIVEFIKSELSKLSLTLNDQKIKLMTPNMRQSVIGIVVNDKLQVDFRKRNRIRQAIYYIKKFGIVSHMERLQIKKAHYLEHLIGQVNFIVNINPEDKEFVSYKQFLIELKNQSNTSTK